MRGEVSQLGLCTAAASAAKAAIEAQVTKVLEGYKAIISASPTGKHTGAGNIKNYALTDNELEVPVLFFLLYPVYADPLSRRRCGSI